MTDKQFSVLRTIVVVTAFFSGGAILFPDSDFGVLFMIAGGVLLVKDYLIEIFRQDGQVCEKTEEKKEE
ncbi:MAG: hypothetical protein K2O45_09255 [Oscillospiraceae bacterium]|nr:hypothetical protein [Oscillospiraceae bacterium]